MRKALVTVNAFALLRCLLKFEAVDRSATVVVAVELAMKLPPSFWITVKGVAHGAHAIHPRSCWQGHQDFFPRFLFLAFGFRWTLPFGVVGK